jgi:sigma-54 specific flagellar transcriptional regulator A
VSQELIDGIDLLHSNSIVVIDKDQNSSQYLSTIFQFMGCTANFLTDPGDLPAHLDSLTEKPCLAIFLGSGFTSNQLQDVAKIAASRATKLPVFMFGAKGELPDRPHGDVLGNIVIPFNLDMLINLIQKAQVFVHSQASADSGKRLDQFRTVSGRSQASKELDQMIQQVASTNATVLILGESGTGKEVVARKLHLHSNRRSKPFVPVNCGAIPEDLLESELFGHEKGAFTGAITARKGRFEMAEGGTLFLDEIGDMSMPMQVKILRVLQERTFERVGSNKTIECDVRILAATHRNLEARINEGLFREDLFYRLNVFPIDMPPLRDRTEDIPMLVHDLIRRVENENRGSVRLTPLAVSALTYYNWPGNVRELANLIERLTILFPYGVVDVGDLPEKFREGVPLQELKLAEPKPFVDTDEVEDDDFTVPLAANSAPTRLPPDGLDLKAHLVDLEKDLIQQALDEADGVVAQAAKILKMRRTTLVEKLRKYDMRSDKDATLI